MKNCLAMNKQASPLDTLKTRYISALLSANFHQMDCRQEVDYMRCSFWRSDEFGCKSIYTFAFWGDNPISEAALNSAKRWAQRKGTTLILVSDASIFPASEGVTRLNSNEYFARLGGRSPSYLVLQPKFAEILRTSAKNKVPKGCTGKADTIFEDYVHAGLQFILPAKVIQYGQERNFEALPDGIALSGSFNLIYDAKAAQDGYDVNSNSIRQFGNYVDTFHQRYSATVGRVHSFLVVSGDFQGGDRAMENRREELQGEYGVPLCFLKAQDLADIVSILIKASSYRQTIPWKRLLSKSLLTVNPVQTYLNQRQKDSVLPK